MRFAAAIIATGNTFQSIHDLFLFADMKLPLRKDQFYRYQRLFSAFIAKYESFTTVADKSQYQIINWLFCLCSVRNQILDGASKARHGSEVTISIDGRWSSRRQALEGTVTCFDAEAKEIIDIQHIG